jgi:hypothetical protein
LFLVAREIGKGPGAEAADLNPGTSGYHTAAIEGRT